MKKPDSKKERKIDQILVLIGENYGKEINANTVILFQRILEPYSIKEIEAAFFTWLNSTNEQARYFPKTNDIVGIIRKHQDISRQKIRLDQARLPLQPLTEEQIEANLKRIRDWKKKKLSSILKTIKSQEPINYKDRLAKLRRQARELEDLDKSTDKEEPDNERETPGDPETS